MSKLVGIIGAMDIEVNGIVNSMTDLESKNISGITFYKGKLYSKDIVVAKCGIGKVFASICAQTMILEYKVDIVINTGVAGSLTNNLKVLDIAIASKVVQHDMDTSPLGDPKGLISGINVIYFDTNNIVKDSLKKACEMADCRCYEGVIASGDKFIANKQEKIDIASEFNAIACEMEGAAIGHTCFINNIPFGIIRAISDGDGAEMDYQTFSKLAAENSIKITKKFVEIY